jgi:20S proteasome alpha/beta subunit
MTVVVGVPGTSVVIAADQQHSVQGYHKFNEEKILLIDGLQWAVALAYAGSPNIAREAEEKIQDRLFRYQEPEKGIYVDQTVIRDTSEEVLLEIAQRYYDIELQMLVGASTVPETPNLWVFDRKSFREADDLLYLGVGESSVSRYLKDRLSPTEYEKLCGQDYPLERKIDLAIYLIEQAKNYVDGCGGPTNLVILQDGGDWRWLTEEEVEGRMVKMRIKEKDALRSILFG